MKNNWSILWVAFSVGVLATFVQFAVPPLLPFLQEQFALNYTEAGLLMTVFALATLICAAPCGLTIQRYGVKKVGLTGLCLLFIGVGFTYMAQTYPAFLASRIVQGVGFGLVAVAAPSAIGQFIPRHLMAIAMGIWSTWIPFGGLIMFFAAPRLLELYSISTYWVILMAVLVPGMLVFSLVIPSHAKRGAAEASAPRGGLSGEVILGEIRNPNIWYAAVAFGAFTLGAFSLGTWTISYMTDRMSMSMVEASRMPIMFWIINGASNVYGGLLLKKFGARPWVFVLPPLAMAILWPLCGIPIPLSYYIVTALIASVCGIIPTIVFASAPVLAKRKEGIGVAMAIIIIGENLGVLSGPVLFGMILQHTQSFLMSFSMLSIGSLIQIFCLYKIWRTGLLRFSH